MDPKQQNTGQGLLAVAVLGVLAILILPLPAFALDILLAFNIGISVLILLVSLSLEKPLDFSVFPSLLLITTLFRLGLNVATTRLILLKGGEGARAAGDVIETFGRFAVGGSLIVGAVVFLILLAVNFSVITRGSGRVAEVAARFTLDALPGKQMSIDADLAAGLIDERGAKARRSALEREIEFFGAMDGASKFVRGDAVAGLIITAINIVGGLAAGLIRDHMSLATAAESFTILTIGDGLVSQMPALLISTAAGIVVTRAGSGAHLGLEIGGQMFGRSRTLTYAAGVLCALAIVPGLPTIPFGLLGVGAYVLSRRRDQPEKARKAAEAAAEAARPAPERMQDLIVVDAIELEVGHALLRMIDLDKGGELPGRVTSLRKQIATDLGVVLPPVHLRDNLRLEPNEYRIRLRGIEVGKGSAYLERLMVLDPSGGTPHVAGLDGISAKEPAFGLNALWVVPTDRARAESAGLTVVDPPSVVTTHLSETIRRNVHELVGRQEVQELLGALGKEAPKLVEDTIPGTISLGDLVRVVRGVLREGLSVRDLRTILEAVADAAPRSKDTAFLVEQVRRRLFRQITARVADPTGVVRAVTLDRVAEDTLRRSLGQSDGEATLAPDIDTARRLVNALEERAARFAAEGQPTVIIAPPDLRRPLFDFASRFVPDLSVITARELVPGTTVEPVATIDLSASAMGRAA
jgi:flagellar biosynthesis protein FlhA